MKRRQTFGKGVWSWMVIVCLCIGPGIQPVIAEQSEVLRITVGKPTLLSDLSYQNSSCVAVSRTGVVAAFYPKPGTGPNFYRTSIDGGATWGPEMASPPLHCGGAASVALRDGGVLKFLTVDATIKGEADFNSSPLEGEIKDGWFTLHSTFAWFNDDFTKYTVAPVRVYMPDAVTTKQTQLSASTHWPIFDKGKILQLANGDLLAPMHGLFKGDTLGRVLISCSSDRGHTWHYYATVAYQPADPNPELPGQYVGVCEPTIELLPNGQMICVMRTQYSHLPAEYRPLSVSWSSDLGKTWTKPVLTNPHLMNIWPTLAVLDNGVVVCQYGRPGFHVAFSIDNGHTWRDRISFSDLHEPLITGQCDMSKVGPNRLVAIGGDAEGTKVWPIEVERVKVGSSETELTGRVLDQAGQPIAGAKVELGPNRYTADSWMESEELDSWKAARLLVNAPVLGYQSISEQKGYPIATTDASGRFDFKGIKLVEYILTVEADGCAPQWRHVNVGSEPQTHFQEFKLKAGKSVRGRVVDQAGKPVGGVCVVLDKNHIHADCDGFFHWAIDAPVPNEATVDVYKRYNGNYAPFKEKLSLSQMETQPIVLQFAKATGAKTP